MHLSSMQDFAKFTAGILPEDRNGNLVDQNEFDFAVIGTAYDEHDSYQLFDRTSRDVWQNRGTYADRTYTIQCAFNLWKHWGRSENTMTEPEKPGRWACIRCGKTSDDLPARFDGDYERPICDRCGK